jgi:1-acyl-sn-glycerol-3-phosphate acyltransferase
MRTLLVILTMLITTPPLALLATIAAWVGVKDGENSLFNKLPRIWSRALCWAGGVKVVLHGNEHIAERKPRIFMANHVGWFDIFALASELHRYKFIGKAELARIPIFGKGAVAAAMIPIERENRKSAFQSYAQAAQKIHEGASVIVFPEGTRGYTYELRPFKKGAFVLAVTAGVPIIPTIVHGAIEIQAKGKSRVKPGRVDVHFLEPVETAGLDYEDREELARTVWNRMSDALRELYGVESDHAPVARGENVPKIPTSFL